MGEKKRSKEDEEALDRKIAEIRKKNLLIAQRKEVVDEDRANFANAIGETIRRSESPTKEPKQSNGTVKTAKSPKKNVWDREWDAGKTSADTWKENVPEMGRTTRGGHSSWGQRGRFRGGRGRGSNRNDFSMHDDRTAEPKKQPERHVSAENPSDGANIKVSVQNEKVTKTSPTGKRQSSTHSEKPSDTGREKRSPRGGGGSRSRGDHTRSRGGTRGRPRDDRRGEMAKNERVSAVPQKRMDAKRGGKTYLDTVRVNISTLGSSKANNNAKSRAPPTKRSNDLVSEEIAETVKNLVEEVVRQVELVN